MSKKKILIVDDEKDALFVLGKELTSRHYEVISAENGNDALSLAESEQPNLIILDIWMPGMDGAEVSEKLRENPKTKDIPVVFLTCLLEKKNGEGQGRLVANKVVIAKPYDIESLSSQIERLANLKIYS
ncbi:MAG: response regulator [Planctomycetes bacterium]|nr:response regulator [Planctomycetota bacterium]